jgi:hypothetical protein
MLFDLHPVLCRIQLQRRIFMKPSIRFEDMRYRLSGSAQFLFPDKYPIATDAGRGANRTAYPFQKQRRVSNNIDLTENIRSRRRIFNVPTFIEEPHGSKMRNRD